MSRTKKLVFAAMMISVGILLPMAFHAVPNGGAVFAPMHLPVLLAGFICGPAYGLITGAVCPLLSFIFTGMPTAAYLPNMMAELLCYGAVTGLVFRIVRTGRWALDIYLALLVGMLVGRIAGGITAYLLFLGGRRDAYSWAAFFTAYFVTCLPAIAIQIVVVPAVVDIARRSHFLRESDRYLNPDHYEKNAKKQRAFFDGLASVWREKNTPDDREIGELLSPLPLRAGDYVLDAACGSGVLDGYLTEHGYRVDGLDISSAMIERARKNPRNESVRYTVADFYRYESEEKYDCILLFDAYPHFPDKRAFAEKACDLLRADGVLCIFFDAGRDRTNGFHVGAEEVSFGLKSVREEARVFRSGFTVCELYEDENVYRMVFRKKSRGRKK